MYNFSRFWRIKYVSRILGHILYRLDTHNSLRLCRVNIHVNIDKSDYSNRDVYERINRKLKDILQRWIDYTYSLDSHADSGVFRALEHSTEDDIDILKEDIHRPHFHLLFYTDGKLYKSDREMYEDIRKILDPYIASGFIVNVNYSDSNADILITRDDFVNTLAENFIRKCGYITKIYSKDLISRTSDSYLLKPFLESGIRSKEDSIQISVYADACRLYLCNLYKTTVKSRRESMLTPGMAKFRMQQYCDSAGWSMDYIDDITTKMIDQSVDPAISTLLISKLNTRLSKCKRVAICPMIVYLPHMGAVIKDAITTVADLVIYSVIVGRHNFAYAYHKLQRDSEITDYYTYIRLFDIQYIGTLWPTDSGDFILRIVFLYDARDLKNQGLFTEQMIGSIRTRFKRDSITTELCDQFQPKIITQGRWTDRATGVVDPHIYTSDAWLGLAMFLGLDQQTQYTLDATDDAIIAPMPHAITPRLITSNEVDYSIRDQYTVQLQRLRKCIQLNVLSRRAEDPFSNLRSEYDELAKIDGLAPSKGRFSVTERSRYLLSGAPKERRHPTDMREIRHKARHRQLCAKYNTDEVQLLKSTPTKVRRKDRQRRQTEDAE